MPVNMPAFQITTEGNIQFPEGPHSLFIKKTKQNKTKQTGYHKWSV